MILYSEHCSQYSCFLLCLPHSFILGFTAPTIGDCIIEFTMNCTTSPDGGFLGGVPCTDIPGEEQPVCTCPECVREMVFVYTGELCVPDEVETCTQFGANPATAVVMIGHASDASVVFFEGVVSIGDTITIKDDNCIPDSLVATVGIPVRCLVCLPLFFICASLFAACCVDLLLSLHLTRLISHLQTFMSIVFTFKSFYPHTTGR
jgi:hypothetical protein